MKKPRPGVADVATEEQPQRGGSYLRDPDTGALTRVEGPEDEAERADTDDAAEPATDNNSGAAAGDAPATTDQEG